MICSRSILFHCFYPLFPLRLLWTSFSLSLVVYLVHHYIWLPQQLHPQILLTMTVFPNSLRPCKTASLLLSWRFLTNSLLMSLHSQPDSTQGINFNDHSQQDGKVRVNKTGETITSQTNNRDLDGLGTSYTRIPLHLFPRRSCCLVRLASLWQAAMWVISV